MTDTNGSARSEAPGMTGTNGPVRSGAPGTDTNGLLLRDARRYGDDALIDVHVRDGRIVAAGPAGTVPAPGAEPVRLDGRHLGPGLWDEHVHFTQWVIQSRRVDLSGAAGAAETAALVRAALTRTPVPAGGVLSGYGFRDALWPDRPTLRALDEAAPGTPVVLVSADLHCGWINSAAAARMGVTVDESGVLREGDWIGSPGLDAEGSLTVADYRDAARAAARRGVVGIVDFEHADNVRLWPERVAEGVTSLRVEASIWPDRLDDALARGLRTGAPLDPAGLVTVGRLKVVVDGSLNTRTALCWDPYPGLDPGDPHACGVESYTVEELRDLLTLAWPGGIEAAVHAIGDRANSQVVDVFEELGRPGVIEHAQLVRAGDFARFARLGLVASVQPEHAMDDRDVADRLWEGRTGRAFAFASLHEAGVALRLGSDAPVAPLDPWQAVASAISRSRGEREPWHPEQRLPRGVALAAASRGRAGFAPGDPADLVVLDRDPATADRDELRTMPVAGTLLAGHWTWRNL
ncbi:amidohydrolase [Nonomuraea fuscirosea]|uniref:amidohydrolase n=1 Tax=Nonomuraea fuscirosea TaxID=1291556 RepID=UPI0033E6C621